MLTLIALIVFRFMQVSDSESLDHDATIHNPQSAVSTWSVLPDLSMPEPRQSIDLVAVQNWVTIAHEANHSFLPAETASWINNGWEATLFGTLNFDPMHFARRTSFPSIIVPEINSSRIPAVQLEESVAERAWTSVARRVKNLRQLPTTEATRAYAINRWKTLLQVSPKHSSVGRLLQQQIWDLYDDSQISQTLEDVFSVKSTATLLKRGASLYKFFLWRRAKSFPFLPIQESVAYAYLYDDQLRSATGPSAFRECLNFSAALLGLDGALDAASSVRIIGYCKKKYMQKAPLKQARVLSTSQVISLESMLVSDRAGSFEVPDRIMAGHALFVLYSRSRWTDSLFPSQWAVDEDLEGSGFFQADTLITKTAMSAEKKTKFLPLTGHLHGLSTNRWFQTWLMLRAQAGLKDPDGKNPLICSVRLDGTFSSVKLTSSDAGSWLRDLLKMNGYDKRQTSGISSHSLKATLLSWCSKYGLPLEIRQALGYHAAAANTSAAHYSRDELAGPLRKLEEVIAAVRDGSFRPDQTRSGYMRPTAKAASWPIVPSREDVEKGSLEAIPKSDQGSSSDSSGSSSSSAEESDNENVALEAQSSRPVETRPTKKNRPDLATSSYFIHSRWKTIHIAHKEISNRLVCGRIVTALFKSAPFIPAFEYHRCADCFRT
jgi:hypothetical protein